MSRFLFSLFFFNISQHIKLNSTHMKNREVKNASLFLDANTWKGWIIQNDTLIYHYTILMRHSEHQNFCILAHPFGPIIIKILWKFSNALSHWYTDRMNLLNDQVSVLWFLIWSNCSIMWKLTHQQCYYMVVVLYRVHKLIINNDDNK